MPIYNTNSPVVFSIYRADIHFLVRCSGPTWRWWLLWPRLPWPAPLLTLSSAHSLVCSAPPQHAMPSHTWAFCSHFPLCVAWLLLLVFLDISSTLSKSHIIYQFFIDCSAISGSPYLQIPKTSEPNLCILHIPLIFLLLWTEIIPSLFLYLLC